MFGVIVVFYRRMMIADEQHYKERLTNDKMEQYNRIQFHSYTNHHFFSQI